MNLRDGLRFLGRHLAPQRRALLWLALWSAVEALPAFLSGILVAAAVDRGFLAGRPLEGIAWLAALAGVWVVGALGTRQAYPWLAATVEPLRDSMVSELVAVSLRTALRDDDPGQGAVVAQATVQVEMARELFATLLRTMRQLLAAGLAALGGLAVLSPLLALVVGGLVLPAVGLFAVLVRVLVRRYRTEVLAQEEVTARAAPVVQGARDVVVAGAQARAARHVGEAVEAQAEAERASARARAWRLPVVVLGAHVPLLALLAVSPWLLEEGRLTVGEVVGGVVYLATGLEPAIQLVVNAAGTIVVNLGVVLGRLAETCAAPPAPAAGAPGAHPAGSDVDVDRVTFGYSAHAEPVIRDLSLHVAAGAHLAVVGPSGIGKSTLADLLTGLSAPQAGCVRLGGVPLAGVDEAHLRRTVALIPQEAYVFAGSVRDNLRYLRPDATDEDLDRSVDAVGLGGTVARLGGYDAAIDPGDGTLSPAARQLVALARVHLSPADVVVLDEATCHLDPVAEAWAEQAFARRPGTLVVIAHRISSALRAERVLVMDADATVLGRHEELLQRSALYAQLVGHWTGAPLDDAPAEACTPVDRRPAVRV